MKGFLTRKKLSGHKRYAKRDEDDLRGHEGPMEMNSEHKIWAENKSDLESFHEWEKNPVGNYKRKRSEY